MRIYCTDRNQTLASACFSLDDVPVESIMGQVRGPFCAHSRTLPANTAVNQGVARIVDPCYWTPKLPFLYEAKLQLETDHGRRQAEFRFGLRWCVTDGAGLRLNARRFVLRCVSGGDEPDLDEFRAASASLWMTRYCEQTCARASECGVIVACADPLTEWQAESVYQHPAVFFAASQFDLSPDVLTMVGDRPRKGTVFVVKENELDRSAGCSTTPWFVLRPSSAGSVIQLRRECDALQRDVATVGQFSGYVVHAE